MIMFCIFHREFFLTEYNKDFIFFGVNEAYYKKIEKIKNVIYEYELEKYNPFLQKRGYLETSAYLHVYWNKLYKNNEMVGFSQYDMTHNSNYDNLDKNTMYIMLGSCIGTLDIVKNGVWSTTMYSHNHNLNFLIESYNKTFGKTYSITELEGMPSSYWHTNIYPIKIYEKLCIWLEKLVEEVYPWLNQSPWPTGFGALGGYMERAICIFNAFEIYEGCRYEDLSLNIIHKHVYDDCDYFYNEKLFLNNYSRDVNTKYIKNITGNYDDVDYCMWKSMCYFDGITYSCERILKNGKIGLYFKREDMSNHREEGFDIDAQDPRIFVFNETVYVVFICLSPYENQDYSIGITPFNEWNPIFLQIENIEKNPTEKNWAPFVKDNRLYFVYNYDPLIIIEYDLNQNGICKVVYTQENCSLPINTSLTYLRGGSNLIHYKDGYYIGACHSRIFLNEWRHQTHIILLNTTTWELVYVSKPVIYLCDIKDELNAWWEAPGSRKKLDTLNINTINTNILFDKTPHMLQSPASLYLKDDKYFITINVRNSVSLLYEVSFANLFDLIKSGKQIGYYDNYVKECISF